MRLALALLVLVSLLPPQPAVAQNRTPTPSAEELWEAYPLHPRPTPHAASPVRASAPRPAERPAAPARRTVPAALLGLLGVVIAAGLLALPELRRRRSRPPPPALEPARDPVASPPDPHRPWIATIEWRAAGAQPRFCVCARGERGDGRTVLASSAPLNWPPDAPASVQALTEAANQLEAALLAAGWKPLPPGREWYAKRFSWRPVRERGSRRFVRRAPRMEARRAP